MLDTNGNIPGARGMLKNVVPKFMARGVDSGVLMGWLEEFDCQGEIPLTQSGLPESYAWEVIMLRYEAGARTEHWDAC